jgi:hypothetical protein
MSNICVEDSAFEGGRERFLRAGGCQMWHVKIIMNSATTVAELTQH